MIRIVIGSLAAAVAMFFVGFVFWATPLSRLGLSSAGETQGANIQAVLAQNLEHTGRYVVPSPDTSAGTVLFGKGPIALIDYNSSGFSTADPTTLIIGFIQNFIVALIIGVTLLMVARRVGDFASRVRLVLGLSGAATLMITLSEPIFMHADWRYAIFSLVGHMAMLAAGGLVIVRWFLPRPISTTLH